jgi:hypothetical protein
MTSTATLTIGLVVEANADADTVRLLVARLFLQGADWVTPDMLEWRGFEPHEQVAFWKNVSRLCTQHKVRIQGKFDETRGAPDAYAARSALMLFSKLGKPDRIILVRDADNQPDRITGLHQGRTDDRHKIDASDVAIGVAIPEREAWHLVGFIPNTDDERQRLAEERQRLGFDPTRYPHRLRGNAKRNAKPVLDKLTAGDPERERQCLTDLPLDDPRCEDCGLTSFLTELRERVVTAIV